ncbi:MAG: tetratricopeptide repeat protein [Magnetococcales bacterium]|nr:tetratricopeptide repeat protein [Magnetococcales bacterium]
MTSHDSSGDGLPAAQLPDLLVQEGLRHHHAGDLALAESCYRQVLQGHPDHPDALHLLGLIDHQRGDQVQAMQWIARAIAAWPGHPIYYANLGLVLARMGELEGAVTCYRQALAVKPDYAEACNNLGLALMELNDLSEARSQLQRAIILQPDYPEAHNNLGLVLCRMGEGIGAKQAFQEALRLRPEWPEALLNLGSLLRQQGDLPGAIQCCRQILAKRPDDPDAWFNLGNALRDQGNQAEATDCYERVLALVPDYFRACNNLGCLFQDQGDLEGARRAFLRTLAMAPDYPEAHNNLGTLLQLLGRPEEALACFQRALELDPEYADAHVNRAMAWLAAGQFLAGWQEYAWRWYQAGARPPGDQFSQPLWQGESLLGKRILLHAEQGLGDTLQFIRYAPLVKKRGGEVLVQCQPPLTRLLSAQEGIDLVLSQGDSLPEFDCQVPLLSLPGIFGTDMETIPAQLPYIVPEAALVESWQKRMPSGYSRQIGLVWRGSKSYRHDRYRSLPAQAMAGLLAVPEVAFYGLVKEPRIDEIDCLARLGNFFDFGPELKNFSDTAAIVANLDLIITVDTAVAHLAGAMGKPVWVLLPFSPDWRWLREGEASPWYPGMRLVRQSRQGDWSAVLDRVLQSLWSINNNKY